jgi:hypothetical protein
LIGTRTVHRIGFLMIDATHFILGA